MKPRTRFAILALIPLGCATAEDTAPDGANVGIGTAGSGDAGQTAGSSGASVIPATAGSSSTAGSGGSDLAGSGGSGLGGTTGATGGSVGVSGGGGASAAGTFGSSGTSTGGKGGTAAGGTAAGGTAAGGTGGSSSTAGTAGTAAGGSNGTAGTGGTAGTSTTAGTSSTAGTGGTGVATAYCDNKTKAPLPYTANDGFQPSGWQGDTAAIAAIATAQTPCTARTANAVGDCSAWRFTPNATTQAWGGVVWSTYWDPGYTHPPVCLAAGATKVTFQARGLNGGEVVTFSAAGAAELPFTLTNAWKEYTIPLTGIQYNTPDQGVPSGFFWKVAPPTPAGAPVTFFVDDIQFAK